MPKIPEKSDVLKEARLSLANPVGYCGHHCNFCTHKFCGGCRSDYRWIAIKVIIQRKKNIRQKRLRYL